MTIVAIVAILATLLVVVLQIITLSILKSTNKKVDELAAQKSNSGNNDRDKRDRDFRPQQNNRRPAPDAKPKAQNQPAAAPQAGSSVDQVEKSLRDINLKLKNAERDQENARKNIQTNYQPRERDPNFKRRDSRDGGNRGGRDRQDRPGSRDRRGGNSWQDRSNRPSGNSGDFNRSSEQPTVSDKPFNAEENPMVNQLNADATVTSPSAEPMDFAGDDSLQHGRKVAVKRRMLKEEDSVIESTSSENSGNESSQESSSSASEGSSGNDQDSSSDSDIKFGRR